MTDLKTKYLVKKKRPDCGQDMQTMELCVVFGDAGVPCDRRVIDEYGRRALTANLTERQAMALEEQGATLERYEGLTFETYDGGGSRTFGGSGRTFIR